MERTRRAAPDQQSTSTARPRSPIQTRSRSAGLLDPALVNPHPGVVASHPPPVTSLHRESSAMEPPITSVPSQQEASSALLMSRLDRIEVMFEQMMKQNASLLQTMATSRVSHPIESAQPHAEVGEPLHIPSSLQQISQGTAPAVTPAVAPLSHPPQVGLGYSGMVPPPEGHQTFYDPGQEDDFEEDPSIPSSSTRGTHSNLSTATGHRFHPSSSSKTLRSLSAYRSTSTPSSCSFLTRGV